MGILIVLIGQMIFSTVAFIYFERKLKAYGLAIVALAEAVRLLAERQVKKDRREAEWN
jgi:hypothetical protein